MERHETTDLIRSGGSREHEMLTAIARDRVLPPNWQIVDESSAGYGWRTIDATGENLRDWQPTAERAARRAWEAFGVSAEVWFSINGFEVLDYVGVCEKRGWVA